MVDALAVNEKGQASVEWSRGVRRRTLPGWLYVLLSPLGKSWGKNMVPAGIATLSDLMSSQGRSTCKCCVLRFAVFLNHHQKMEV